MALSLYESVYKPRAGGTTTQAVARTLDGSALSQTEVLLREAVQNSYDAKLENKSLLFNLNCYKLNEENCNKIKNIFSNSGKLGKSLASKLNSSFYNLEITDRNSTGLSGYSGFRENNDNKQFEEKFHHFIYMTGNDEIKDKESGGSFGFGKASLYKYSKLRTIIVYTRVYQKNIDNYESRFIICKIDERESSSTGRCWWGQEGKYLDNTTYARPLLNQDADIFASLFGMQKFLNTETGTDILILDPIEKENISFETTFQEEIPCLITHWFWPKIISQNISKKINFSLSLNSDDISEYIPDPRNTYPYSSFCRAFRKCVDYYSHKAGASSDEVTVVNFERPQVELGAIILKKESLKPFMYDSYINTKWEKPHIALMRDVEFIVKYEPIDIDISNTGVGCFGIFHTNRLGHQRNNQDELEVEHYFRSIENQTHNEWTHTEKQEYNYLRKVETTLYEAVRDFMNVTTSIGNSASISGLVAQKLGKKLGFGYIGGASRKRSSNFSSNGQPKKSSSFVKINEAADMQIINGQKYIILQYEAKLLSHKKLYVKLEPTIHSFDPNDKEIANDSELSIEYLERKTNSEILKLIPLRNKEPYTFFVQKSGTYKVYVKTTIQCAFDISINKEEVDG